jgi:hypothetical protein
MLLAAYSEYIVILCLVVGFSAGFMLAKADSYMSRWKRRKPV